MTGTAADLVIAEASEIEAVKGLASREFRALHRTVLEIGVDGTIAVVIVDRPPEISEFNATGTVTVLFDVISE